MKLPSLLSCTLPLFLGLGQSLDAQGIKERFESQSRAWESSLDRGDASGVRKGAEAILAREGTQVNPSDYNGMRALVAVMDAAARACIQDGAWEDGVSHLQKAAAVALDNAQNSETTFGRLRREHEQKLTEWRDLVVRQEPRLRDLEERTGLSEEQVKLKGQLRAFLDEHRNAISHSERCIKDIDNILGQIRKDQEAQAKSLGEWQAFLAKEKQDLEQAGGPVKFVAEKLEQVKADDARPRTERLAYGRRLQRLDPSNPDCLRFVNSLMGMEEPATAPTVLKKAPAKKTKKK